MTVITAPDSGLVGLASKRGRRRPSLLIGAVAADRAW